MESSKSMHNKQGDWERLESVIKWANMTTNYFARHIGIPKAETLYRIKRGQNGISNDVAGRVVEHFPQINLVWLKMGFGEMFGAPELNSCTKPFYPVGVEEHILTLDATTPHEPMMLPWDVDFDFGIYYYGHAMSPSIPAGSVVLLKKILPEMIILDDECVIVTKKVVHLRVVKRVELDGGRQQLRLVAADSERFDDIIVDLEDVESVYRVSAKILKGIN